MSQMTVGIRELKSHLSRYVRRVKSGATVIITDRGKPVGCIVPLEPSLDARLLQLVEAGQIAWSGHKLASRPPVAQTRGKQTVADLLLEDRA